MQEHELKEYQRLRSAGRWNAASEFREAERKRLRAAGRTRQQAREESWEAMLAKFPPHGEQPPPRQPRMPPDPRCAEDTDDSELPFDEYDQDGEFAAELKQLAMLTDGLPTDADRDINFAYRIMALPTITPMMAPSTAAWQWYLYARREPHKFLEIFAKREDAKAKSAGTMTQQRMEDDKRKQFALIDRIEKELTVNVQETVSDLMSKFPEDVLLECRRHTEAWNAFFEKYPESNR